MAITALPAAPQRNQAPATFIANADAFVAALPQFVNDCNNLASSLNSIAAGTATAIAYTFSTTTTDSDPGNGTIRLDNATQNLATTIRTDLLDTSGIDWTAVLDTLDASSSTVKGQVKLVKAGDGTKWILFNLTARATPAGYRNLTVSVTGSSSANPFANNDSVLFLFTRTGDIGLTGSTMPIVAAGGTVNAITATYNPAITLADKTLAIFISTGANTSTTPTFAPNGLTAHTITTRGGLALNIGDIGPAGYAGFVEYNLANTRWELLNPIPASFGSGGGTATGSITLVSTSNGAQVITPASPGLYATLPDATTCTKAATLFVISNIGEYDYGIKNSAGTQLGWVRPGKSAVVGLGDNSTAAGTWAIQGIEKLGVTASLINLSATNTNRLFQRITVDSNRTAFIIGGTSCYVVIYDSSQAAGSQWGAVTLVRSGISNGAFLSILSGAAQLLVVSNNSTTGMEAVTITLTGGTGVTINSGTKGTATLAGNLASFGQLKAIGSTWCVSYGRATSVTAIREITISGTTPTISAEAALPPANTTSATLYSTAGAVVLTLSSDATTLSAKPYTLNGNGTAPTAGTVASITVTAAGYKSIALGSGRWAAMYLNTTAFASIISVSGTVATASSATHGTAYTGVANTLDVITVSSTKLCVCYNAGSNTIYSNIITDNAGTISNGTEVSNTLIASAVLSATAAISLSGNTALFSVRTNTSTAALVLDVSGASPVISNIIPLKGGAGDYPQQTDIYCIRSSNTLIAGNVGYSVLGVESNGGNLRCSSSSVQTIPLLNLPLATSPVGPGAGYSAGAASNESWFVETSGDTSTGILLAKVEAAA